MAGGTASCLATATARIRSFGASTIDNGSDSTANSSLGSCAAGLGAATATGSNASRGSAACEDSLWPVHSPIVKMRADQTTLLKVTIHSQGICEAGARGVAFRLGAGFFAEQVFDGADTRIPVGIGCTRGTSGFDMQASKFRSTGV